MNSLVELVKTEYGDDLVSVAVFGSIARGTAREDSDLNVLIIASRLPRSRRKRVQRFLNIESKLDPVLEKLLDKEYPITVSPVILTADEAREIPPLFLDLTEDAVILYDKDNFLKELLTKLKAKLQEIGATRIWIGSRWYWKLKHGYSRESEDSWMAMSWQGRT
ncbi:MAG: nucleotidyltransferase domain-containing protein [Candidatus Caldarchaeales archaeon]